MTRPRTVVATISSDCHTWNLVFFQLLLEERGHYVVNCGPCTTVPKIIECCMSESAQLLVISTVNGHGLIEAREYIERIRAVRELADMPVVIGGKLGVHGSASVAEVAELLSRGFDAVFVEGGSPVADFSYFLQRLQSGDTRTGLGANTAIANRNAITSPSGWDSKLRRRP